MAEEEYVLSNREFRNIYRRIMGDTKEQVNIRQAYTILNCSGRNFASDHLNKQWEFLSEKISVDRLYDIYLKADEVVLDVREYDRAILTKTLRVADVLNEVKEGSLVNKQYLEHVLEEYSTPDGFIEIGNLLRATMQSKVDVVEKLLGPNVEENEMEFSLKVRGYTTVKPKVQCITYTIDVNEPTTCEFRLSLANNSDVPPDRFINDLFVVIFNMDRLVGLTRYVLEQNVKYSTGMVTVNAGDEVMIVGMGTSMERKRSTTEKEVLIKENKKLSRRFMTTLMNIFDSFDVNQDGVLSYEEMNLYALASDDEELIDSDWETYLEGFENRDGGLTMNGFIKAHEVEAIDTQGNSLGDLWHSLHSLGYDSQLCLMFGCSYDIEVLSNRPISLIPRLQKSTRKHRSFVLEHLYQMSEEDDRFEIRPHLFKTDYFGLLIVKREESNAKDTYQMVLEQRKNIKINFPHKVDELIRLADSDSDWVLLASYSVTDPNEKLEYNLVKVDTKSTSPSLLRA